MTTRRLTPIMTVIAALLLAAAPSDAQIVDRWNEVWLDSIRQAHQTPGPTARQGAILHASIQDAINSITRQQRPMVTITPDPVEGSTDAAGAAAAHRVLSNLYPQRQAVFDAELQSQLSRIPDSAARQSGLQIGRQTADAVLSSRADDGSSAHGDYTPQGLPGTWRPTPPDNTQDPYNPEWPDVTPWTMTTGSHFRPPDPPAIDSQEYAESLNNTRALGARYSDVRTQEQTDIALFWANDRQGTFLPIGQLNHMTQVIANDQNLNTHEQAHLFAISNIAMADAGIVAWDTKYDADLWRPVTAIREADTDGNPATEADPDWLPLFPVTPPFPAYVSGHATFSAAHAAVLEEYFGTDDITFTITTDEPLYEGPEWRTYDSLSEAALENAESRIFLGVHYDFDGEWGNEIGDDVGRHAFAVLTEPIPEPGTGMLSLLAIAGLACKRHHRPVHR